MNKTALQMFQEEVNRTQTDRRCSFEDAYYLCSVIHRSLFAEVKRQEKLANRADGKPETAADYWNKQHAAKTAKL